MSLATRNEVWDALPPIRPGEDRPLDLDLPGLRPHDLRHTAATAWLMITGDVKAVQTLLGHATASMTLDLYSHLLNDIETRAADLMAQGLAQAREEAEPKDASRPGREDREPAEKAQGS